MILDSLLRIRLLLFFWLILSIINCLFAVNLQFVVQFNADVVYQILVWLQYYVVIVAGIIQQQQQTLCITIFPSIATYYFASLTPFLSSIITNFIINQLFVHIHPSNYDNNFVDIVICRYMVLQNLDVLLCLTFTYDKFIFV